MIVFPGGNIRGPGHDYASNQDYEDTSIVEGAHHQQHRPTLDLQSVARTNFAPHPSSLSQKHSQRRRLPPDVDDLDIRGVNELEI